MEKLGLEARYQPKFKNRQMALRRGPSLAYGGPFKGPLPRMANHSAH